MIDGAQSGMAHQKHRALRATIRSSMVWPSFSGAMRPPAPSTMQHVVAGLLATPQLCKIAPMESAGQPCGRPGAASTRAQRGTARGGRAFPHPRRDRPPKAPLPTSGARNCPSGRGTAPVWTGFIIMARIERARIQRSTPAVTRVLPTPVPVPVMKMPGIMIYRYVAYLSFAKGRAFQTQIQPLRFPRSRS